MIITNKTLSPQYLLWLGGPMAAVILLVPAATEDERRSIRRLALQLLGLALLTHLVYPLLYDGLLGRQGHLMIIVSTTVTALRNLALLLFTIELWRMALRSLAPPARPSPRKPRPASRDRDSEPRNAQAHVTPCLSRHSPTGQPMPGKLR
jgi:hypothetical protein